MERTKYVQVEHNAGSLIGRLEETLGITAVKSAETPNVEGRLFTDHPHSLLPTIGIEIELPHRELDRRLDYAMPRGVKYEDLTPAKKTTADKIFDDIDTEWLPKVDALKQAGIIIGNDSLAEIISPPFYESAELKKLTDYLFYSGFLPTGGALPLHLTLGNINAVGNSLQVHYLARMIELLDGSTDIRMHEPLMGGQRQWTQKSNTGFKFRTAYKLAGGQQDGLEFRALVARNAQQVSRVMWRAQWLGASLKAWLDASEIERANPVNEVSFDEYERGLLIDTWKSTTRFFEELYKLNGIELDREWGGPDDDPQSWTGHRIMCSISLGNVAPRQQVCDIVDQILHEAEQTTVRHHSRRLASGQR